MENKSVEERAMELYPSWAHRDRLAYVTLQKVLKLVENPNTTRVWETALQVRDTVKEALAGFEAARHDQSEIEQLKEDNSTLSHMVEALNGKIDQLKARQDQGVVGTQGREAFIEKIALEFQVKWMASKIDPCFNVTEWKNFMRAHWPVSEGEGMYSREQVEDAIEMAQEMTDYAVSFKHTKDDIFKAIKPQT